MTKGIFAFALAFVGLIPSAQGAWLVKYEGGPGGELGKVISVQAVVKGPRDGKSQVIRRGLDILAEGDLSPAALGQSQGQVVEVLYGDHALPEGVKGVFSAMNLEQPLAGAEVQTLVNQGPVENRIDLTIVGDGYTESEKAKFFDDARRITQDLFGESTFETYLPLFNVHAVFVPSRESGLTDGSDRRDTALGLYRDPPGSKRAIMPGNSSAIERALRMAPGTDYPILVANDDYYGGLGGRYAITTRSVRSGKVVLRHELGHNFGNVGEEYDGGNVYRGANHSRSPDRDWGHWMSHAQERTEVRFLNGQYLWQNLGDGAVIARFTMPGSQGDYEFDSMISTVGWETMNDVYAYLDGTKVEMEGDPTDDRGFFRLTLDRTLAPGNHTLEIRENIADGDNVLAFAQLFAIPKGTHREKGHVGAYRTYNAWGSAEGYRPTFDTCLMRNMESRDFCVVDLENMWIQFLRRVSLLDGVTVSGGVATAQTPDLKGLDIQWFLLDGWGREMEIPQSRGEKSIPVQSGGTYRVKVAFRTEQVKRPTSDFEASKEFTANP